VLKVLAVKALDSSIEYLFLARADHAVATVERTYAPVPGSFGSLCLLR
jgi:hypothetical protein